MRSSRRECRGDDEILCHASDLELLRAVAAGAVVRGDQGGETSIWAPRVLNGEPVSLIALRRLQRDDLITVPISGPPRLAPRGVALLSRASGTG